MSKILSKIQMIDVPSYSEDNGDLIVLEDGGMVPFSIARVFVVNAEKDSVRGEHAHKECTQLLNCLSGSIDVLCDDGRDATEYTLTPLDQALLIPAGVWAVQKYKLENSSLMVLCDQMYNENDYIRDYSQFIEWNQQ